MWTYYFLLLMLPFWVSAQETLVVLDARETDDCVITWIKDEQDQAYLIKQIKDPSPDEQFLLVLDTLACFIAEQMTIPINRVRLIPADVTHAGKYFEDRLATIHTLAPGLPVEEYPPWPNFKVHQLYREPGSWKWLKWGPLPFEHTGLTRSVIKQMSSHPLLPLIVALDTFTGNADRSNPNLFYDVETDAFCGIDMAAAFHSILAKPAYEHILLFAQQEDFSSSDAEQLGLYLYYQTLAALVAQFPPDKLVHLLFLFAEEAGFKPGSPLFNQDVQDRLSFHQRIMRENYHYSVTLLALLSELLEKTEISF